MAGDLQVWNSWLAVGGVRNCATKLVAPANAVSEIPGRLGKHSGIYASLSGWLLLAMFNYTARSK